MESISFVEKSKVIELVTLLENNGFKIKNRACPKNCVNGHNEVEIPKEKRWPRHDKKRKRMYWTNSLTTSTFGG